VFDAKGAEERMWCCSCNKGYQGMMLEFVRSDRCKMSLGYVRRSTRCSRHGIRHDDGAQGVVVVLSCSGSLR
jgi:hypothetical protein